MTPEYELARYGSRAGEKVGGLTFVGTVRRAANDNNRMLGAFQCDCGRTVELPVGRVLNSKTKTHCGCLRDRGAHRTHGMRGTLQYTSWQAMKRRCLVPDDKDYPRYGGKGVTVFPEWATSFQAFYDHIGERPPGTTLDRIDTTKGYDPGNVRWATIQTQQRNRRSTFDWHIQGHVFATMYEAADHFGVSSMTIGRWVKGFHDRRRNSHKPPKENCYVVARY